MSTYKPRPRKSVIPLDNGLFDIDGSIYNKDGVLIARRSTSEKLNITLPRQDKMSLANFTEQGFIDREPLDLTRVIDATLGDNVQTGELPNQQQNIDTNIHTAGQMPNQAGAFDHLSFSDAFRTARQQGLAEFSWRVGQNERNRSGRYTTELAQHRPTERHPVELPQAQQDHDQTKTGVGITGNQKHLVPPIQSLGNSLMLIDNVVNRNPNINPDNLDTQEGYEEFLKSLSPEEREILNQSEEHFAQLKGGGQPLGTGQAIQNVAGAGATLTAYIVAARMYKNYIRNKNPINYAIPRNFRTTPTGTVKDIPKDMPRTTIQGNQISRRTADRLYRKPRGMAGLFGSIIELPGAVARERLDREIGQFTNEELINKRNDAFNTIATSLDRVEKENNIYLIEQLDREIGRRKLGTPSGRVDTRGRVVL